MKAEDDTGEGSYSPVSPGPSPLVACPLMERPGNSRDQKFLLMLEGLFQALNPTIEFAQSLINCS